MGIISRLFGLKNENIGDTTRDFVDKEKVLKIAIYKEAEEFLESNGKVHNEDLGLVASNLLACCFNQDLKTLKTPMREDTVLAWTSEFFESNPEVMNMVVVYLRTASVIHFAHTKDVYIDPDSLTGKLLMQFGEKVPAIGGYNSFTDQFDMFMKTRW